MLKILKNYNYLTHIHTHFMRERYKNILFIKIQKVSDFMKFSREIRLFYLVLCLDIMVKNENSFFSLRELKDNKDIYIYICELINFR